MVGLLDVPIFYPAPKTNTEPENYWFVEENTLLRVPKNRVHVSFRECIYSRMTILLAIL